MPLLHQQLWHTGLSQEYIANIQMYTISIQIIPFFSKMQDQLIISIFFIINFDHTVLDQQMLLASRKHDRVRFWLSWLQLVISISRTYIGAYTRLEWLTNQLERRMWKQKHCFWLVQNLSKTMHTVPIRVFCCCWVPIDLAISSRVISLRVPVTKYKNKDICINWGLFNNRVSLNQHQD